MLPVRIDKTRQPGDCRLLHAAESACVVTGNAIVLTLFSRHFRAELSYSSILLFVPVSFLCLTGSFFAAAWLSSESKRLWLRTRIAAKSSTPIQSMAVSPEGQSVLRGQTWFEGSVRQPHK